MDVTTYLNYARAIRVIDPTGTVKLASPSLSPSASSTADGLLSDNQSTLLLSNILKASPLTSREFVQYLAEDFLGASRLPAVVADTRLASAHALATRCI